VLFELIAERYERKSIAITANQPFSAWDQIFPDAAMTTRRGRSPRPPRDNPGNERRELPPASSRRSRGAPRSAEGEKLQRRTERNQPRRTGQNSCRWAVNVVDGKHAAAHGVKQVRSDGDRSKADRRATVRRSASPF